MGESGPCNVAPPFGAQVAAGAVKVEVTEHTTPLAARIDGLEAAAGQLNLGLVVATAATGDDVESPCQRVAAEGSDGSADHIDPLHVVQRDEVEVHLRRIRLVHADPVDEDAEALRQADHRRHAEAAKREVGLRGGAQFVVRVNPWQPAQGLGDR